jgi:predicted DNA-binding protein
MTTQMIIRIDPDVKEKIRRIAMQEGKTTSQIVREMIEERIKERDISSYIDGLWDRVGRKFKSKSAKKDIDRVIRKVRSEKQ